MWESLVRGLVKPGNCRRNIQRRGLSQLLRASLDLQSGQEEGAEESEEGPFQEREEQGPRENSVLETR